MKQTDDENTGILSREEQLLLQEQLHGRGQLEAS